MVGAAYHKVFGGSAPSSSKLKTFMAKPRTTYDTVSKTQLYGHEVLIAMDPATSGHENHSRSENHFEVAVAQSLQGGSQAGEFYLKQRSSPELTPSPSLEALQNRANETGHESRSRDVVAKKEERSKFEEGGNPLADVFKANPALAAFSEGGEDDFKRFREVACRRDGRIHGKPQVSNPLVANLKRVLLERNEGDGLGLFRRTDGVLGRLRRRHRGGLIVLGCKLQNERPGPWTTGPELDEWLSGERIAFEGILAATGGDIVLPKKREHLPLSVCASFKDVVSVARRTLVELEPSGRNNFKNVTTSLADDLECLVAPSEELHIRGSCAYQAWAKETA
ncbi:hypothetical protein ON010_g14138 [Phytophthora cinnamomi]|nr:hypothetical protein ON010_g14138 [Phytophthora cinnamomi]